MLLWGIIFSTVLPTFTKNSLKQFTILNGPVISSPLESRIEISVLFDDIIVYNSLVYCL